MKAMCTYLSVLLITYNNEVVSIFLLRVYMALASEGKLRGLIVQQGGIKVRSSDVLSCPIINFVTLSCTLIALFKRCIIIFCEGQFSPDQGVC